MKNTLQGKDCLIIGGSRGIGFAIASHLYSLGADVIIASKNKSNAKKASLSLSPKLDRLSFFKIDISNSKDVNRKIDQILERHKKIDVLICSAGIFEPIGAFTSIPFAAHEKTVKTNLIGVMNCTYKILPHMVKKRNGKIIFFSGGGVGGDIPLEHASSYFVSKGALALFAEVIGAEVASYNIQVNAISPGRILTDLTKSTLNLPKKQLGNVLSKAVLDLKKSGGQPVEPVLKLVTFLLFNNILSGKLFSARWDNIESLSRNIPSWKYTLKRIEGKSYVKKNIK